MELSIEYCGTCNYRPIAASLAMTIEKALGIKAVLIHSNEMGALEVKANGKLVFSKKDSRRFPNHAEVVEILSLMRDRETLKLRK